MTKSVYTMSSQAVVTPAPPNHVHLNCLYSIDDGRVILLLKQAQTIVLDKQISIAF